MIAKVMLGDVLVGRLTPGQESISFTFDADYLARADRPVLSRSFEERELSPDRIFNGSREAPLPTFFRNALPEGALRKVLEARLPRSRLIELDMLLRLGGDLPGNLRVVADPLDWTPDADSEGVNVREGARPPSALDASDPIRFSLAGIQLKASVLAEEERVTLPLVGQAGNWIAKFPSAAFRDLPENEMAILRWARAAGLDVPDHRLIDVASIQNLPSEFSPEGRALLIKRFDRRAERERIHQEDFAQVFEIEPEDKYRSLVPTYVTYAGIGAVIRALAGEEDFREFVRRVAFVIISGNGDAHVKNWALIYPDGIHPRLSPVYDVVATVAYPKLGHDLALAFVEAEDPNHNPPVPMLSIEYRHFREMADLAGEPPNVIEEDVRAFIKGARAAWLALRDDVPPFVRDAVTRHLEDVSL